MTTMNMWLPLTDYSTKYKVSVSTLRRRIKSEDIRFRLDDGKYFIIDEPIDSQAKGHRPSLSSESANFGVSQNQQMKLAPTEESVLDVANRLLSELKRAYTLILAEKEEQMLLLKEEVSDLKTLVRVLESENDRLKGFKQ